MTSWFSIESIVEFHSHIVRECGGQDGVRDKGLLDSALNAPFQSFDGIDLFPSVLDKAARLAFGIIENHPFIDGNKRTGVHVMLAFLRANGVYVNCSQSDLIEIAIAVAEGRANQDDLLDWLNEHI